MRDHNGYTPLEALQAQVERNRIYTGYGFQRAELMADKFEGYDDATIDCLIKLLGVERATAEQRERVKFGCSCGSCVSGFLSPRMFKKLHREAEVLYKLLSVSVYLKILFHAGNRWAIFLGRPQAGLKLTCIISGRVDQWQLL
jgi:hypothetical protein